MFRCMLRCTQIISVMAEQDVSWKMFDKQEMTEMTKGFEVTNVAGLEERTIAV